MSSSISFSIQTVSGAFATASILLQQTSDGVYITVVADNNVGDITGVFFDIADNNICGLSASGSDVTGSLFKTDRVSSVGNSTISNSTISKFDGGVAIGTTGGCDFITSTSFLVSGATLSDFLGQRFGVRLNGNQGSSRLVGIAEPYVPPTPSLSLTIDLDPTDLDQPGSILKTRYFDTDGVDSNGDGKLEKQSEIVLIPEVGKTYDQLVRVANTGSNSVPSGTELDISASHDFVKIIPDGVSFSTFKQDFEQQNPGIEVLSADTLSQTIRVRINTSIPVNGEVAIRVTNTVADTGSLVPLEYQFSFQEGSSAYDFGNALVQGTHYIDRSHFTKNVGESQITFNQLPSVGFSAAIVGSSTSATHNTAITRSFGTITEEGGKTHRLFITDNLTLDTDTKGSAKISWGGSFGAGDLSLLWAQAPNVDITPFIHMGADVNTVDTFLDLIDAGLFDLKYASEIFEKDGNIFNAGFAATYNALDDGTNLGAFNQMVTGGQVIRQDSVTSLTFNGGSFQAWVDANLTNPDLNYVVAIASTYNQINLTQRTVTLDLYDYVPDKTTIGTLYQIRLPNGVDRVLINNSVSREIVDLSSTTILTTTGTSVGVRFSGDCDRNVKGDTITGTAANDVILGSNGSDVLNGSLGNDDVRGGRGQDVLDGGEGNDLLNGGAGCDTFVFKRAFGNDTIVDFNRDKLDLRIFGLTSSQFNASKSLVSNNLVIDLTSFDGGKVTLQGVQTLSNNDVWL